MKTVRANFTVALLVLASNICSLTSVFAERVDVQTLAGDGSNQFIITQPGSYYLTGNINGVSGKNGIAVNADNVTLDLNGFAVAGVSGSLNGIAAGSNHNLSIFNGTVRGWGQNGIAAGSTTNSQFYELRVSNNGTDGVVVGSNSTARECVAERNGGSGIRVLGTGSRIENDSCNSNTGNGIRVDTPGNLIVKNNASFNAATDYNIAAGSSYGQIAQAPGAGFTAPTAWANFSTSCPQGQVLCAGVCSSLNTDVNNCGTCGNLCTVANGTAGCSHGTCVIASCNNGFGDCNGNSSDGCETNLTTSLNNCGTCGRVCTVANGTAGCVRGNCVTVSCNNGFGDCNGNSSDGCETNLTTNVNNCGTCGRVCVVANGTPGCVRGMCVIASCNNGFGDCNGNSSDGCETNLSTDPNNCGTCGRRCASGQACIRGVCL